MNALVEILYLIAVILLIVGLSRLSHPKSARLGNFIAATGMGIAIIATFVIPVKGDNNYSWIIGGLIIGSTIGLVTSKRIAMTAMPELVSLFNGLGGACAVAISGMELYHTEQLLRNGLSVPISSHLVSYLAMFVGGIAFTGSLLAYGKLAGLVKDLKTPVLQIINIVFLLAGIGIIGYQTAVQLPGYLVPGIVLVISLVYGVTFVQPIGGADMPVVISLLNAFTGVAAALAGLIYTNQVMLVGGILVGASGTILTILMCNAMNRSLFNVIIGGLSGKASAKVATGDQVVKEANVYDVAVMLRYASRAVFVPGYGMAVAQAQKAVRELDNLLSENGVEVKYAIHPVAGRMPGHMNVLLAEANVPYPALMDLDEANDYFPSADVCVVVGANDVVNPSALDDPASSIYGMPILEILKAKQTIVLKRSMRTGYAGIENPLFFHEKTKMLFGDAKASIEQLVQEVKAMD